MMYKIVNDLVPSYLVELRPDHVNSRSSRNLHNNDDLIVPFARTERYKKSFIISSVKRRLQSLLLMCDRFVMRSLLITSFQSHGVNENTRGRLNRSLLYCKERWRINSWHKNCCFELEFQDQTINIGFWKRGKSRRLKV